MHRVRTAVAGIATATLLLGATAPVAAQTTTTVSAAEAGAAGLTLTVAGTSALTVAETAVAAVPGEAAALGNPLVLAGEPIGGLSVDSDGAAVAADDCVTPAVPAPLDALLDGGVACADVAADGDARSAAATAGVADAGVLNLDGVDLGPLNDLLATLDLDALTTELEEELLTVLGDPDLLEEVRDGCIDLLETLEGDDTLIGGLLDLLTDAIATLTGETDLEVISETVEELLDSDLASELTDTVCDTLGDLADTLLDGDLVGDLTSGDLLAALEGTTGVLDLALLETTSVVDRDGDDVTADAGPGEGAIVMTLDLPLLDELLGDLLESVVDSGVADLLEDLDEVLDGLDGAVSEVPLLGEIISPLLDAGTVGDLLDGPLLDVGVFPGSSAASGDLGDLTTDGDASPALVSLGGSLLSLPVLTGLDEALDAAAGVVDDEVLATLRDTPLVDVLDVELLPGEVVEDEVQGLTGTRATSGTASVALLAALGDPLVDLQVAPAVAAVGVDELTTAAPEPTPVTTAGPDPDPLPVTGAGAALFGLLALGAAGLLRRRG